LNEFERYHRETVEGRDNVCAGRPSPHTHQTLFNIETIEPSGYFAQERQIGLLLNSELADPPPDGMFPAALKD
jgi:hypothetical protein